MVRSNGSAGDEPRLNNTTSVAEPLDDARVRPVFANSVAIRTWDSSAPMAT